MQVMQWTRLAQYISFIKLCKSKIDVDSVHSISSANSINLISLAPAINSINLSTVIRLLDLGELIKSSEWIKLGKLFKLPYISTSVKSSWSCVSTQTLLAVPRGAPRGAGVICPCVLAQPKSGRFATSSRKKSSRKTKRPLRSLTFFLRKKSRACGHYRLVAGQP